MPPTAPAQTDGAIAKESPHQPTRWCLAANRRGGERIVGGADWRWAPVAEGSSPRPAWLTPQPITAGELVSSEFILGFLSRWGFSRTSPAVLRWVVMRIIF